MNRIARITSMALVLLLSSSVLSAQAADKAAEKKALGKQRSELKVQVNQARKSSAHTSRDLLIP